MKLSFILLLFFFGMPHLGAEDTSVFRKEVPFLFQEYGCKTVHHIPCRYSDWILKSWEEVGFCPVFCFVGMDPEREYVALQDAKSHDYWVKYILLDPKSQELPKTDLLLCQDFLNTYSDEEIIKFLDNLKRSGSGYLLSTHFSRFQPNDPYDGSYREINFLQPPFNFPFPIKTIQISENEEKSLALWKVSSLPGKEPIASDGITIERNHRKGNLKIALVTFISDARNSHVSELLYPYPEMVKFGTRSKQLYCKKHGYDFYIGSQKMYECGGVPAPNPDKLSIHWMKVPMLEKFLSEYDWVVWIDADTIFLNPEISLESLIDEKYDLIFGTCHLEVGEIGLRNSGFIFVKDCPWSRDFLAEWWQQSEEKISGTWDLEALPQVIDIKPDEYKSHIKYLPVRLSDLSHDEYRPGDFNVHFYGAHGYELYLLFQQFESKYKKILDDLEESLKGSL